MEILIFPKKDCNISTRAYNKIIVVAVIVMLNMWLELYKHGQD